MKKITFLVLALFGVNAVMQAQEGGNIEFAFGIGLNSSNVSSSYEDADYSTSFNIEAGADYYFSESWSVKAKIMYDRKGWDNGFITIYEGTPGLPSGDYRTDYNLDYITVPVMASWHFGRTDNWYLNFGPYAGFLISAKDTTFDLDLKDGFETTDFGLAFGIGVKIPVTEYLKIFIEYDGQSGFSEIFKENEGSSVTNNRGAFNVGVNFML